MSNPYLSDIAATPEEKLLSRIETQHKQIEVPLSSVKVNEQVRKDFDDEYIKSLAETIKNKGLVQPIVVHQPDPDVLMFDLVTGENRLRAFYFLNKKTIPVVIKRKELTFSEKRQYQLIENLKRKDLNVFEIADGIKDCIKVDNLKIEEISSIFGMSVPSISEYHSISKIPQKLRCKKVKGLKFKELVAFSRGFRKTMRGIELASKKEKKQTFSFCNVKNNVMKLSSLKMDFKKEPKKDLEKKIELIETALKEAKDFLKLKN
jgi:ParB family transcriptional regulator, chromosome partitioning protein